MRILPALFLVVGLSAGAAWAVEVSSFWIYELKDHPGRYVALGQELRGGWHVFKAGPNGTQEIEQEGSPTVYADGRPGTLKLSLVNGEHLLIPSFPRGRNLLLTHMKPTLVQPGRAPEVMVKVRTTGALLRRLGLASFLAEGERGARLEEQEVPALPAVPALYEIGIVDPAENGFFRDQNARQALIRTLEKLDPAVGRILELYPENSPGLSLLVRKDKVAKVRALIPASVGTLVLVREQIAALRRTALAEAADPGVKLWDTYLRLNRLNEWHHAFSTRLEQDVYRSERASGRTPTIVVGTREALERIEGHPYGDLLLAPIREISAQIMRAAATRGTPEADLMLFETALWAGGAGMPLVAGLSPSGATYLDRWLASKTLVIEKMADAPRFARWEQIEGLGWEFKNTHSGGIFEAFPLILTGELYGLRDPAQSNFDASGNAPLAVLGLPGEKRALIKAYISAIRLADRRSTDAVLKATQVRRFDLYKANVLNTLRAQNPLELEPALSEALEEFWMTGELRPETFERALKRAEGQPIFPTYEQLKAVVANHAGIGLPPSRYHPGQTAVVGTQAQADLFRALADVPSGSGLPGYSRIEFFASALQILIEVVQAGRLELRSSMTLPLVLEAKINLERAIAGKVKTRDRGARRLQRLQLVLNQELNARFVGALGELQSSGACGALLQTSGR